MLKNVINNKFKGMDNSILKTVVVLKIMSKRFKNKKIKITNKLKIKINQIKKYNKNNKINI